MATRTDLDFGSAMKFAVMHLAQAQRRLSVAAWAAPETIDTIEGLRKQIDKLAKRIERERARWERERDEN